ncbi:MAG: 2-amino-4-oxopentanoate thiolase subunit OrtA [Treponema sp.]|nr:2-amino-4-oxopentanoate thiolase subunit OrtA [Treponema sp.]
MAEKGAWARIKKTVLQSGERADRLPEETRGVPFVMWVKGSLVAPGEIGEEVTVLTKSGRLESGELVEINPFYNIGYGEHVEQLRRIGDDAREILFGEARA